jgi:hypothetical protein
MGQLMSGLGVRPSCKWQMCVGNDWRPSKMCVASIQRVCKYQDIILHHVEVISFAQEVVGLTDDRGASFLALLDQERQQLAPHQDIKIDRHFVKQ